MIKKSIICLLLCAPVLSICGAGLSNEKRAQELLDFLVAGQGDSIYVRLNDEAKGQLSPAMLNGLFNGVEQQFGELQSRGQWEESRISEVTVYFCDLQFKKIALRFLTAFDADGRINTLRFVPVPTPDSGQDNAKIDKEKATEHPIEVVCGAYKLPGVFTLPKGGQNVPVVILVHGSGPTDRDETIGANKPFRDIAWELAGRGIASVRYDKRTKVYGAQYAPADKQTYDEETVDDALAAIDLAKTIQSVDAGQIYVVGHSLGAMLAPRIAERSEGLAGIIMLAGNARPLEDVLVDQIGYLASIGISLPPAMQLDVVRQQAANVKKIGTDAFDATVGLPLGSPKSYWVFSDAYRQVKVAEKLTLPILILQGERDYQVTMEDFEIWRTALSDRPNASLKSYPALNHLFHEGQGKATPSEYSGEKKNMPGYVFDDISGWIKDKNSIK